MTEDGTTLSKPVEHSFITARPKVVHSWFNTWRSPTLPVMRITFNQPVSRSSVENHLYIDIPWLEERRIKINAEPDENEKETPMFLPLPGENITLINIPAEPVPVPEKKESFLQRILNLFSGPSKNKTGNSQIKNDGGREARRVWLVYPEKELPEDSSPSLMIEPGLESYLGPEKGAEKRELVQFNTFPEFRFEGLDCFANDRRKIHINPGDSPDTEELCNPTQSVTMVFTSPVLTSEIQAAVKFKPSVSWNNENNDYTRLNSRHRRGMKYYEYLPRIFKADQKYIITTCKLLADEFGRKLKTPIKIGFSTDHMPSDYSLTNPISILEKDVDTDMPVIATNINKLTLSYDSLTSNGEGSKRYREIPLPKTKDVELKIPMGIREMLSGESGVVKGSVTSRPYIMKYGDDNFFFGEVTPFQVHVKVGHFNTLVWVTNLKTGEPVRDATVSIYLGTYATLPAPTDTLAQGVTDSEGLVTLAGSDVLDPNNKYLYSYAFYKGQKKRRHGVVTY